MNEPRPSKHIGALIVPLIGGALFAGGVRENIEYIRWLETAPGMSSVFGQSAANFHLNPFPGRLLWDVVAVSLAGALGFACVFQAIVRDKEGQGKLAAALVAGIFIPLLLIIGISSHENWVTMCDAHHTCDLAQGQWLDAPGFFWLLGSEVCCWIGYAWFDLSPARHGLRPPRPWSA